MIPARLSVALQAGVAASGELASKYGPPAAAAVQKAVTELGHVTKEGAAWAGQNPGQAIGVVAGAVGVTMIAAPAAVAVPVLAGVGFGAGGVGSMTAASAIQAGIGNVAAGSAFATLQSAAAGGAGMAVVAGITQGCGAVVAATVLLQVDGRG